MACESPPEWALYYWWNSIYDFVMRMNRVYDQVPFKCNSWWRSQSHNAAVGGARWSQHLIGCAADVAPTYPGELGALARAVEAQGMIAVRYSTYVHAQLWPAGTLQRLAGG
jgi:hypothetical protein